MTRNTLRRVEVASPVYDPDIRARILDMFDTMLRDNVQAREMGADGLYRRLTPGKNAPLNSQEYFSGRPMKPSAGETRRNKRTKTTL